MLVDAATKLGTASPATAAASHKLREMDRGDTVSQDTPGRSDVRAPWERPPNVFRSNPGTASAGPAEKEPPPVGGHGQECQQAEGATSGGANVNRAPGQRGDPRDVASEHKSQGRERCEGIDRDGSGQIESREGQGCAG